VEHRRLVRLGTSRALKEKRLESLLAGRDERDPALADAVAEAQVQGSLALSGIASSVMDVRAARRGLPAPAEVRALVAALAAVPRSAPLSVQAIRSWHAAALEGDGRFRAAERAREGGPPPAPAAFVASRLEALEHWLQVESSRDLEPAAAGALALARIVEILPFDDGNGRVSRLAAAHVMAKAGARAPILVRDDEPRLREALQGAFRLETRPLASLLDEASERSLDVMIRALASPM
jgi:Fic family protein